MTGIWLAGCATGPALQEPVVGVENATHDELLALPPPAQKIAVAVYAFEDETGQFKFSDTVQTLSRAVTQGATSILIEALLAAGNGSWFTVVEREGIDNLLRERQIIRETRAIYEGEGEGDLSRSYLPPLLFAGMLLEGGIIGFDSNTLTGGLGARLLGIGGNTEFRQDTVTVYLRAISTQSGEVLESVNVSKTIFSVALAANVFRFIESDEILEVDAGISANEPEHIAIKMAIDKAVVALVLNGTRRERWAFADPAAAAAMLAGEPEPSGTRHAGATAEAGRSQDAHAPAETIRLVEARAPERTRADARGRTPDRARARTAKPGSAQAVVQRALDALIADARAGGPAAAAPPSGNRKAWRAPGKQDAGPDRALLVEVGAHGPMRKDSRPSAGEAGASLKKPGDEAARAPRRPG